MIPQSVYDRIKYASGGDAAGPSAVMGEYTLTQKLHYPSWRAYVVANKNGKRIALAEVPASAAEDWRLI